MRNVLFVLSIITISSCSNLTPFTKSIYDRYDWSEDELQRIQFYLSDDIVLKRELGSGTKEIINGDVKIIDGKEIEVVKIPKGTPGIMEYTRDRNKMAIRFEEGGDRYLMFGPNPKYGGKYMLLASEWTRVSGKVHYEGNIYRAENQSQLATLMIDLKRLGKTDVKSRTADGVRVNKN
jgi:hypothetical protein